MLEEYLSEKQKKKRERRRRLWWLAAALVVCGACISALWIIEESPIFRIDRFVVTGNKAVAASDIVTLLQASMSRHRTFWFSFLGMDNMLAWPKSLTTSDVALVPQLASATLQKNYGDHTLTVSVAERVPLAIWCEMPPLDANGNPSGDESCFWFDNTGTLFQKAFDTEGSELFAVHDYAQTGLGVGGKILPDLFISNLISILDTIEASSLTIKEIALNDLSLEEIDVSTYNGPMLYFSLRFSASEDLPVLQELMEKPGFSSLQYVDFRTENRAYYK
jgi:hypothetical protein